MSELTRPGYVVVEVPVEVAVDVPELLTLDAAELWRREVDAITLEAGGAALELVVELGRPDAVEFVELVAKPAAPDADELATVLTLELTAEDVGPEGRVERTRMDAAATTTTMTTTTAAAESALACLAREIVRLPRLEALTILEMGVLPI